MLVFNPDGSYLARFGTFGAGLTNLGLPNGIAIDDQDYIYIADSGNNRILKFEPPFGSVPNLDGSEEVPLHDDSGLGAAADGEGDALLGGEENGAPAAEGESNSADTGPIDDEN